MRRKAASDLETVAGGATLWCSTVSREEVSPQATAMLDSDFADAKKRPPITMRRSGTIPFA